MTNLDISQNPSAGRPALALRDCFRTGLRAGLLGLLVLAWNLPAATVFWVGNSSTNWNTTANWSGTSVPTNNDSIIFTNAGTAGTGLYNNLPAGRVFNGLTFVSNATNAFTLSGNAFGLNGTIANSNINLHTINCPIILAANGSVSAVSSNIVLAGSISDGGSNYNLTLGGTRIVTLAGNNTFGGTLAINSGVTLSVGAVTNLGAGTNLSFNGSASSTLSVTASVLIPAATTLTVGSSSTAGFVTPVAGTVLEVAGRLTGAGTVSRKSSSYSLGTVRFSNDANDYSGDFGMGFGNTEFTSVANQGIASSLGKGAAATAGQITLGNSSSAGLFRYVGAGNSSTTRPLNWSATTGGLALDASGTGTVAFLTNTVLRTGSGTDTLTLQGSNGGTNTLAQSINDGVASGTTTVLKSGNGNWVLAGTNTFTGGLNLNNGVLQVNAAENPGISGPLGRSGIISFGGGTLQFSAANAFDYSSRFGTNGGQAYSLDTAGQTVTFAAALVSSNGTLTVDSSAPGGKLILTKTNTFTGNVTVLGGTLSVSNDVFLGANTNYVVLNGGTLSAGTNFHFYLYRTLALGTAGGTVEVPAGVTLTFDGNIYDSGGPGSLTKTGAGTLTMSSSASAAYVTYTGDTTISNGTLALSGVGAMGTNGNLTIASGATLDVSGATGGWKLGRYQTLIAGNGTSLVKGKLNLNNAALALFWTNGVPSLTISGNTLVMSNNTATVTVAGGTPLPVGVYKLISKGTGGSVTGVATNSLVNVIGAGAVAGASLQITSSELYLNVHGSSATATTLSTSGATQTYGNAVTFTASVSPTNATGIVTFTDGTTTYGTAALAGGRAVLTVTGGVFNAGVYPMTASYNGNSIYAPSVSTVVTQTITQANLTIAANSLSRWAGNANPALTASDLGFVAGDTSDSVLSGSPNLTTPATPASPVGTYPITITPGTLADVTGNYILNFTNGTLSVVARAMPYPQGSAFPLMMYEVGDAPSAANVASYGWNIIQTYGLGTNSDINNFLQLASGYSLGGDAPIGCGGDVSTNFVEWPQAQVQAWIQGSMTNNNIAWWDMPEEMRSWHPTEVQLLKDYRVWIRLYDTNGRRPTYEYTPNARTTSSQIPVVTNLDIIGCGAYCEAAGQPHAWVRYKVQEAGVHAVTLGGCTIGGNYLSNQKTVVSVLYLADPGNGSLPTPQQSYHDVWSSIASGAQGITVWAYWHGVNDNPVLTNNLNQFNLAAAQISGTELGQVFLYGTPNPNVNFTIASGPTNTDSFNPGDGTNWQYSSLNVLCKSWSNSVYVVAVNSTSNSVTATLTNLPSVTGPAGLPLEYRSVAMINGSFSDTFPAWGVHVYKMALTMPNTYTLTYAAGANGTISGITPQTVNYGAAGTAVTAVPNSGYYFSNWSGGSTANPRTDANVTNSLSVTANFVALVPPAITGSPVFGGGGFQLGFSGPGGQPYHVLTSTNLGLPLTNWLVLTNGTFGAGPVNFTDNATTNRQRFYRIASP